MKTFIGFMLIGLLALVAHSGAVAQQEIDRTTPAYTYGRYGCNACHAGRGEGTVIGVPIAKRQGGPLTREEIIRALRTPRDMMPAFPPERLSEADLEKIIAHITAMEAGTSAPRR